LIIVFLGVATQWKLLDIAESLENGNRCYRGFGKCNHSGWSPYLGI